MINYYPVWVKRALKGRLKQMEIYLFRQNSHKVEKRVSPDDLPELIKDQTNLIWVDMEKPGKKEDFLLSDVFDFHPLTIEDARETRNQPKVEAFPDYLFFIVHGVRPGETLSNNFTTKELDGYLGKNYVVTYHHENFHSIDNVKRQITSSPFICQRGASYLLNRILDELVDLYMPVIDDYDHSINEMEERIFRMKQGSNEMLSDIMGLRRSVARLRRISSKQLDVLYKFAHGDFPFIADDDLPFYRDVYDHLQRISDLSEGYRDLVGGLMDIHFNVIATRTNDVMKVLAVFSSIMLPLSLIAGIYGMNFDNMPELKSPYGYFATLGVMLIVGGGLFIYFWRKGWVGNAGDDLPTPDEADIHETFDVPMHADRTHVEDQM
jgi:magnesium transporter